MSTELVAIHGLNCRNAFSGVYLPSETVKKRQPIPLARVRKLQGECVRLNDDIRSLVALILLQQVIKGGITL